MSRLDFTPRLPRLSEDADDDLRSLVTELRKIHTDISEQVNALSEGRVFGNYNAVPSPPESGIFTRGDFIRNSQPVELGQLGEQYIIIGWTAVEDGSASPTSFVETRALTGN